MDRQTVAICIIAAWLNVSLLVFGRGRAAEGKNTWVDKVLSAGHWLSGIVFGDFAFQLLFR